MENGMFSRALLVLIGLANVFNGLAMVLSPAAWYEAVPGVSATGPFNPHFVVDIGLAYLASGLFMTAAAKPTREAALVALAGAVWPALHALFHIVLWFMHGFPREPRVAFAEAFGVVFISLSGLAVAAERARREGAI
jgi:hypothetical protein